jgi:RecG-like helicase
LLLIYCYVEVVFHSHAGLFTSSRTVVDEEQRFGVKQKERLKIICGGIDVLTLSKRWTVSIEY